MWTLRAFLLLPVFLSTQKILAYRLRQLKLTYAPVETDSHREDELRCSVRLVSEHKGFSQEDYEETLTHALHDPISALT